MSQPDFNAINQQNFGDTPRYLDNDYKLFCNESNQKPYLISPLQTKNIDKLSQGSQKSPGFKLMSVKADGHNQSTDGRSPIKSKSQDKTIKDKFETERKDVNNKVNQINISKQHRDSIQRSRILSEDNSIIVFSDNAN